MAINLTYAAQATVLSQGLADVLNSSVVKDVVVACSEGHCLQAHRLILATFSPYFRQLLGVSNEPNPTILLPDITVSVMEILLEFMYTGNVRVKKNHVSELLEANKCLRITGLDEMLSKHVGSSLPPTKKQRIEVVSVPPAKPSSLFRPWDSPVQAPRPEYTLPWLHSLSSGMNSFSETAPLSPSYMPFPRASVNILSNTMPFPMSTGMNLFSEITPNLSSSMSFPLTTGKEPSLASRMPWSISYGNPFLSDAAPVLPTSHSRPIEKPEELLSVTTVSFPTSFGEQQFPISGPYLIII